VKAYRLGAGRAGGEIAASVLVDKVNGMIGLLALGIVGAQLSRLGIRDRWWRRSR
jgi:hypothetical protein